MQEDAAGARRARLDLRCRHDMRGRLAAIGQAHEADRYARYAYAPDGLPRTESLSSGTLTRSFGRDPLQRLIRLTDPAFEQRLGFRRDGDPGQRYADGHISIESMTWQASVVQVAAPHTLGDRYRYDAFGQLMQATPLTAGVPALQLRYDANGNILDMRRDGASTRFVYAPGTDRVQAIERGPARFAMGYTPDGQVDLHARLDLRLARDRIQGRAVAATRPGARMRYLYDAKGLQVLRAELQGGSTRLTLRGIDRWPLVELDGTEARVHVQGPGGLVALTVGGVVHGVSCDNRGSVRLVRAGASVAARFDYTAFGELSAVDGPIAASIDRRYTGQRWDERAGVYDCGARLYDPTTARFLSPDPAWQTPSPYAYVANDPVGHVDRDGRAIHAVYRHQGLSYYFDEDGSLSFVLAREQLLSQMRKRMKTDLKAYPDLEKTAWGARLSSQPRPGGYQPWKRFHKFPDHVKARISAAEIDGSVRTNDAEFERLLGARENKERGRRSQFMYQSLQDPSTFTLPPASRLLPPTLPEPAWPATGMLAPANLNIPSTLPWSVRITPNFVIVPHPEAVTTTTKTTTTTTTTTTTSWTPGGDGPHAESAWPPGSPSTSSQDDVEAPESWLNDMAFWDESSKP